MPPYYPQSTITPNLGLSLVGMDEVIAEDFILVDAAFSSVGGSIKVNGSVVNNPNFVDSATATFSVLGSNISITVIGGGGSGTVTSFSAGTLSPLFTTSVATPTTTPALSFSLSTAAQNAVFAGPTSGTGAPSYRLLVAGDIPSLPAVPANGLDIFTAGSPSPTPIYTDDREIPEGVNPAIYVQDLSGNWHAQAGMDTTTVDISGSGPTVPAGILTWDRIQYFRDNLASVQIGRNAFLSVNHQMGAGTSWNNQDRAIWVSTSNNTANVNQFSITGNVVTFVLENLMSANSAPGTIGFRKGQRVNVNGLTVGTYLNSVPLTVISASVITGSNTSATQNVTASDSGFTHADVGLTSDTGALDQLLYAMEGIQIESDIVGSPTFVSAIDGEVSALSVQMSDQHVGNLTSPNLACNAARIMYFRELGAGTWGSLEPGAIRAIVQDNATAGDQFQIVNGITVIGSSGDTLCPDLYVGVSLPAPVNRFLGGNYSIFTGDFGTNPNDYAIYVAGGQSYFNGTIGVVGFYSINDTVQMAAALEVFSIKSDALAAPAALANANFIVLGTPGVSSVTYVVVFRDGNGNGIADAPYTVTTANATLDSSNSIFFEWFLGDTPNGVAAVELWRTAGGPSQGKIFTYNNFASNVSSAGIGSFTVNDIGIAATPGTVPVGNATGSITAGGPISAGQYTVSALAAMTSVEGMTAYATNGRKVGEGAGSGTGVPVYFSNTHWRVYSTDAQVVA